MGRKYCVYNWNWRYLSKLKKLSGMLSWCVLYIYIYM